MSFSVRGGDNLLWVSPEEQAKPADAGYRNVGGDKVWPAPQMLWRSATGHNGWPPDGVIDGQPWRVVSRSEASATIESRPSDAYGIVVRRSFTLDRELPRVLIDNHIERVAANPFPVTVWSVSQIRRPEEIRLHLDPAGHAGQPVYRRFGWGKSEVAADRTGMAVRDDYLAFDPPPAGEMKVGSMGGWIEADLDGLVWRQEIEYDMEGAYLEATSLQAYSTAEYCELELLSPMKQLKAGETLTCRVVWTLTPAVDP